jgi:low temperature requirement protein LtrA
VIIAELAHSLGSHLDLEHFVEFVFLFTLIWWGWINGSLYHNLHGQNDMRTRVTTFIQMGLIAGMALFAHDAMGDTSKEFIVVYSCFVGFISILWWRTGVHDPAHRPQTIPYIIAYPLAVGIFLFSIFLDEPLRYFSWFAAFLLMIIIPGIWANTGGRHEYINSINVGNEGLIERFNLFTIIVLGEVIVAVVVGMSQLHDLDVEQIILGVLGLGFAFSAWLMYFDSTQMYPPKRSIRGFYSWMFGHLPIWIGIAAVGPAVLNMITIEGNVIPEETLWLTVGAVSIIMISVGAIIRTLRYPKEIRRGLRSISVFTIGLGIATLILGLFGEIFTPMILMIVLLVLMLIPYAYGIRVWLKAYS